jgi:hypothetical protein
MKSFTALLAVALMLCASQVALARPADSGPAPAASSSAQKDLRSPDQVAPSGAPLQDLRSPDQVGLAVPVPESPVATADAISTPADGGLTALWIVLISIGGAVALAAAGYTAMRVVHSHGGAVG